MKALDTNVLVRFLVRDDEEQAGRVLDLFERAEEEGNRFLVTFVVLLETIWVLSSVYELTRNEMLEALLMLSELSVLELEDHDTVSELLRLGQTTSLHLPDLLIGLAGKSLGCDSTLTFEKNLSSSGLFEGI